MVSGQALLPLSTLSCHMKMFPSAYKPPQDSRELCTEEDVPD